MTNSFAETKDMKKTHPLYAGVAREDITPALGTLLMGYADPHKKRKATTVRDPLNATAIALQGKQGDQGDQDGSGKAILMVLDVCIIQDNHVLAIRQGIEARTGIPANCITIATIQTHSAPCTLNAFGWHVVDEAYVNDIMIPKAIEAAVKAAADLVPVRVGFAQTQCAAGVNRRGIHPTTHEVGLGQSAWGIYDPNMTVLRLEGPSGTLANIVHYGAHPTVFGGSSTVISRDWPGIMIDRVEQLTKAPTLFFNGAVGDIAPRTNSMRATGDETEAALWEAGAAAAMDAMRAWRSIKELRDVPLSIHSDTFELPYRPLTSLEEAKASLAKWESQKDSPGMPMAEYKHAQAVVEAHQNPIKTSKPYTQVITALGPAAFVPMPGEVFGETVLRLRDHSPYQHTLSLSTACGNNAYLFTRESIHRGGYEVWVNRILGAYLLADGIDDVLVQENLTLLNHLHASNHLPLSSVV